MAAAAWRPNRPHHAASPATPWPARRPTRADSLPPAPLRRRPRPWARMPTIAPASTSRVPGGQRRVGERQTVTAVRAGDHGVRPLKTTTWPHWAAMRAAHPSRRPGLLGRAAIAAPSRPDGGRTEPAGSRSTLITFGQQVEAVGVHDMRRRSALFLLCSVFAARVSKPTCCR